VPRLSAIIIAKNEARHIGDCLDGLAFCGERMAELISVIVTTCNREDALGASALDVERAPRQGEAT
jgi:hypothetical protein